MQIFKIPKNKKNQINKIHRIRDLNPLIRNLNPLIRNLNLLLTNFYYFHFLDFQGFATEKTLIRNLNLPGAFLQRRYFKNFKKSYVLCLSLTVDGAQELAGVGNFTGLREVHTLLILHALS